MWVPKLLPTPIEIWIFGPNTTKFCPNWHFWPNIGIGNANKVPSWFFRYVGTKTYASSCKNQDFCQKKAKFGPKYAFLAILGQILALLAPLMPCPTKKKRGFIRYVDNKAFASSRRNQDSWPKKAKFGPKYISLCDPFFALLVVACRLYLARHLFTLHY